MVVATSSAIGWLRSPPRAPCRQWLRRGLCCDHANSSNTLAEAATADGLDAGIPLQRRHALLREDRLGPWKDFMNRIWQAARQLSSRRINRRGPRPVKMGLRI